MRSLAVVATFMFLGSAEARFFGRKKATKQVCSACSTGAAECSTTCTSSTVKTITEKTCTTCTKKVQQVTAPKIVPAPYSVELVQKPVAYTVVQKPVPEYVAPRAPCVCNQTPCGPCAVAKPVVPVVTCSVTCTATGCIPCANSPIYTSNPAAAPVQPAQVQTAPASKTTVVVDKRIDQPSAQIIVDSNGLVSVGGKTITA